MEHFLDSARVVPPLNNFKSDTLIDTYGVAIKLELIFKLIDGEVIHFLELVVDAFLHLLVF